MPAIISMICPSMYRLTSRPLQMESPRLPAANHAGSSETDAKKVSPAMADL